MKYFRTGIAMMLFFIMSSSAPGGERGPVSPSQKDKCPVCGMFVAKYPDFLAEVIFKDGSYALFDGPKDMFKYYFNLKKYNPQKSEGDIDSLYVTDYYSVTLIDGYTACYVTGSDVHGPMGRELIPFSKEADAREFMKDHRGKVLLRFKDVTAAVIGGLD